MTNRYRLADKVKERQAEALKQRFARSWGSTIRPKGGGAGEASGPRQGAGAPHWLLQLLKTALICMAIFGVTKLLVQAIRVSQGLG